MERKKDFVDKLSDKVSILIIIWFMVGLPMAAIYTFATDHSSDSLIFKVITFAWIGLLLVICFAGIICLVVALTNPRRK